MGLDKFIRKKLDELESNHDYSIATNSVRDWIDEWHEHVHKSTMVNPDYYYPDDDED